MKPVWLFARRGLRRLRALIQHLYASIIGYAALAVSMVNARGNLVTQRHNGERTTVGAEKVAVFAHYDPRGRVHDYVHHHLSALRLAGFEILFVTNSPQLDKAALTRLLPVCAAVICRKNRGYDFGAYKDGLSLLGDLGQFNEVVLANDSVYGPFHDLSSVLERFDESAQVWGITDSWSKRYHLQSYFLLFKRDALLSRDLSEFWAKVRYVQSKDWVISQYEVGLTQAMLRGGLRCAALCPYRTASAALADAVLAAGLLDREDLPDRHLRYVEDAFGAVEYGRPLNSMHHFWDHLIIKMGCPFIKRDLLMRNPARVPYVYRWENTIQRVSKYDTNLIVRHIQSGLRNRAI